MKLVTIVKTKQLRKIIYPDRNAVNVDFKISYYGYDESVRLVWQQDEHATLIYRAIDDEFKLLSRVSSDKHKYKDEAVVSGKNYRYKIVKEAPDGIRNFTKYGTRNKYKIA